MIREIDAYGVFLPPLLVYAGVAALIWLLLRRISARAGLDRFVWHPALFYTALYVLILAGCIVAVFHWDR
jgi:hypothetical protein